MIEGTHFFFTDARLGKEEIRRREKRAFLMQEHPIFPFSRNIQFKTFQHILKLNQI